jgi:cytochrome b involved in lipid metabolism
MNKKLSIVIVIVVLALIGFFVYTKNKPQTNPYMNDGTSAPLETLNPNVNNTNEDESATTGTPAPTYTLADISTHSGKGDCWTAINGGVYNLTAWISQHPGGEQAILSICGKDGSAAFNAQHGGARQQAQILATFKIGLLKQ